MKSFAIRTVAVSTIVGLLAVGTAGAANAADPGVTPTEIKIGTTTPLTGAASAGYKDVSAGQNAYFSYLNKSGGVNGRQVTLVVKDDAYVPSNTVTRTNELILNDKVFAFLGSLGTANQLAVIDSLTQQGIPNVFPNTGSNTFDNAAKYPTTFPILPSYAIEAKVIAKFIRDTPDLANKKRCFFYQEGEFGENAGQGFVAAGMTDWTAQASYQFAALLNPGLGAQVTRLKAAGCEVVVFFGVTQATALLMATSARLAFKPTYIVTSVGTEPTVFGSLVGGATQARALLNGVYSPSPFVPITDTGNAYVSQIKTIVEASGLPWNYYTYYGVNSAYMFAQALKAAGPNLTRKGLVKALQEQSKNFRSAAVVPFVATKTSHQGLTGVWMGQYDSAGNLVRLGQPNQVYVAGNAPASAPKVVTFKAKPPTPKLLP